MQVKIFPSAVEAACAAAHCIVQRLHDSPDLVLGLATGGTMEAVYHGLIEEHRRTGLSFYGVTTFNLDEYLGLAPTHPASYHATMRRLLFDHIDIDGARINLPDGMAAEPEQEAARYEAAIAAAGGLDLLLLGMGRNGHLAFNEPGTSFVSRTHVVTLAASTRQANARFFPADTPVPQQAISMGMGTILDACEILLVVTGEVKRAALIAAVLGEVSVDCPASALQLHSQVMIYADLAAAAHLLPSNHQSLLGSF